MHEQIIFEDHGFYLPSEETASIIAEVKKEFGVKPEEDDYIEEGVEPEEEFNE